MPTSVEKLSTSEPSPLSPTRWPPDAFAWRRSLAALSIIVPAIAVGVVLDSLIAFRMGVTQQDVINQHLRWGIIAGQLGSYAPVVAALVIMLPWLARRSLGELGLRPLTPKTIGAGVLGALAMYAVTIGVANIQYGFTHEKPQETAMSLFTSAHDPVLAISFSVLAIFVAPFVEELTFRGLIFNVFLRYLPVWLAATISGVLFGLSHLSPSAFLPLAGSGIVLAYVYYLSRSLTASMLTHALFNAINLALITIVKPA